VLVGVMMLLALLTLLVAAVVLAGSRDQQQSWLRLDSVRADYAAESATNMAAKEIVDGVDYDGDGGQGSVSDDANTGNDPTLGGARLWATRSAAGSTTTVTARGQNTGSRRAVQAVFTGSGSLPGGGATVLLVVVNASSLDAQESAKRTLMQGWGYTVTLISESATQAQFDAAVRTSSVAYISETVLSGNIGTKLTNAPIGVIIEEPALSDEFGISTGWADLSTNQVNISNGTHYITSTLGTGTRTIFSSAQPLRTITGTLGGFTTLATRVGMSTPMMAVMERGATMTPSGTAAGRRVFLPFLNGGGNINLLTADGRTIMQRSIEWCLLPVASYALDSASGTTAIDTIAARNGTLNSGPTWTSGRNAGGLRFDGFDDFVEIPNASAFQVTTSLTVAGWIRQTSAFPTGTFVCTILRKGDGNPNNWQLCLTNGRVEFVLENGDGSGVQGNTVLSTNTWHHVAATWDGANVRVYVNGVLDNTPVARTAAIGTDTRPVYLGGRVGATDITTGVLDDVRFYSRALTAEEISGLARGAPQISSWAGVAP
jgi:Tfp pilus assembly protein PilX